MKNLKELQVARLHMPTEVIDRHPIEAEELLIAVIRRMRQMNNEEMFAWHWNAMVSYCRIAGTSAKTIGEMFSMQEQHIRAAHERLLANGHGQCLGEMLSKLPKLPMAEKVSDAFVVFHYFWNSPSGIEIAQRINALHRVEDLTSFFASDLPVPSPDMSLNSMHRDMLQTVIRVSDDLSRIESRCALAKDILDSSEGSNRNAFNFIDCFRQLDHSAQPKASLFQVPFWFLDLGFARYAAKDLVTLIEAPNMDLDADERQKALETQTFPRRPGRSNLVTWKALKIIAAKLSPVNATAVNDFMTVIGRTRRMIHELEEDRRIYDGLKQIAPAHAQSYLFGRFQTMRIKEIRAWVADGRISLDTDLTATLLRRGKHAAKIVAEIGLKVTLDEVLAIGRQSARATAVQSAVQYLKPLDKLPLTTTDAEALVQMFVQAAQRMEPELHQLLKNPAVSIDLFSSRSRQQKLLKKKAFSFLSHLYESGLPCRIDPAVRAAWEECGEDGLKIARRSSGLKQLIQETLTKPIEGDRRLFAKVWNELCALDVPLEQRRQLIDNQTLQFAVKNGVKLSNSVIRGASRAERQLL